MNAVHAGRDSVVVMPTGGGKSLCFQVPAIAADGMAVVVSPLISLMKDQVDFLDACGVSAACIHSGLNGMEKRAIDERIRACDLKILYVAPERLTTPAFIQYLKNVPLSFFAIDEAHCISHWGHDFRPHYRELRTLKDAFDGLPVHAYTATATAPVRDDICAQLGLNEAEMFVGDFDRPNLTYSVLRQDDAKGQVLECVERHRGESGIVYCPSRKKVEGMAAFLSESGHNAIPYHAGMDDYSRKRNQEAFSKGETNIIVATVAFGMGIDKPDVRYVIHAGMPKSLEHYQQEAGRAGRDGLPSECVLIYSKGDHMFWRRLLADLEGEVYEAAIAKLDDMNGYCANLVCRHKRLVEYFGQAFGKSDCGACDVCLDGVECHEDSLEIAQTVLRCVRGLGNFAGPTYTTSVLSGGNDERIRAKRHHELPVFGALSAHHRNDIRDWIEQLVGQGYLRKQGEFNILTETERAAAVEMGDETPRLLKPAPRKAPAPRAHRKKTWEGVDMALVEKLRAARLSFAREREVAAHLIFNDATLRDMAVKLPSSYQELLGVQGIGEKKCHDFGGTLLQVIEDYRNGSTEKEDPEAEPREPARPSVQGLAFQAFADGASVQEVAARLNISPGKANKMLLAYIAERDVLDPSPWVSRSDQEAVIEAVRVFGDSRRTTIIDNLDGLEHFSFEMSESMDSGTDGRWRNLITQTMVNLVIPMTSNGCHWNDRGFAIFVRLVMKTSNATRPFSEPSVVASDISKLKCASVRRQPIAGRSAAAQAFDVCFGDPDLRRNFPRGHHEFDIGIQEDLHGFRIVLEIEVGRCGDLIRIGREPLARTAARHDHDSFDARMQIRMPHEQRTHVGHRA
jgi:ATP-dependent DNA helicase RecQ